MFARSAFAFRTLPLVISAACVALLLLLLLLLPAVHAANTAVVANVTNATQAGFRQMTVTARSADDKPAHFASALDIQFGPGYLCG